VNWKPVIEKAIYLSLLNRRSPPDMSRRPGQDVTALIDLRNALVHFRPEWSDDNKTHRKLSKRLEKRFQHNAWLSNEPIFPRAWVSYSCCKWAIESVRKFVLQYATSNGWPCAFDDKRHVARFSLP
jgi:hypothetical protein